MNELGHQQNNNPIQEIIADLMFKQEQIIQIQNSQGIKYNEVLLQSINDKITEIVTFLQECQQQGITIDCSELNKIDFRPLSIEYLEKLMATYKEVAKEEKEDKLYTKRQYLISKLPCNLMPYLNPLFPYDIFYSIEITSDEETIVINHKADLKEFAGSKKAFIKKSVSTTITDAVPFSLPPAFDLRKYQVFPPTKIYEYGIKPFRTNFPKAKTVYINGWRAHVISYGLWYNLAPWGIAESEREHLHKDGMSIFTYEPEPGETQTKYSIIFNALFIYEKLSQDFYDHHRFDIKALCEYNLNSENLENILTQYSNALSDMQIKVVRRNTKIRKP